jgi:hypothetical protein
MPKDNFKINFWKKIVLYEIYSKKSKVTNTYVHGRVSRSKLNEVIAKETTGDSGMELPPFF